MDFGYSLLCEQTPPKQLISDGVEAEEAGFDYVTISDHYFPWLEDQGHSAYAWSVLGALAHATHRVPLITLVTCPTMRYHPAVVAQKAATMGVLSDGRFILGLGAGENLNEHVVGRDWPPADVRHAMFGEAVDIIRRLFGGGYVNYRGEHYRVDSAKLYDLPDRPVPIGMAAFGPQAGRLAAEHADILMSDQPVGDVVRLFGEQGGAGKPVYGMIPVAFGEDRDECERRAHRIWRFSAPAWKVMSELPGPVNFEAATKTVRPEDVVASVPCGDDVGDYVQAVQQWADAGFTHISFCQSGADRQKDFRTWAEADLLPVLRERFG
ncbi:TIGR03557 family F420-dependent LLM class oxidoreductase [Actinomadura geliboluensis]|uniref:TIGR03557 family F420-dependent LLM class oxidoreductase n=1 Tax=Actinomadura geliboluensis TaxID=882440 RepID=A0A5S4HBL5_9ACTN|nr:TIGR03557 family F420-dependent LLM class oxidoreductase [Actinomadura geliboluensis]TMR42124.1 TIGR03557 family F420-dependent LLM class oxidoreductase [Actinomadura geliboluensis]